MAIKIIRMGQIPAAKVYEATCKNCSTHFQFTRSDGRVYYDQRDGDYLSCACPLCAKAVSVNL